jgi:hypothetical protein
MPAHFHAAKAIIGTVVSRKICPQIAKVCAEGRPTINREDLTERPNGFGRGKA